MHAQIIQLPVKPPVTIGLIALNVYVHLANPLMMAISNVCLQPATIISHFQGGRILLERLFLSSIVHADDMHLYVMHICFLYSVSCLTALCDLFAGIIT